MDYENKTEEKEKGGRDWQCLVIVEPRLTESCHIPDVSVVSVGRVSQHEWELFRRNKLLSYAGQRLIV